ncbi:HelD family protein [Vagococcus jeotgali]|uniref:HelD family protein n=1 Tax=Vagococcus jeotgali TaxID=3109030 RepID=UPI002DDAF6DD|nr:UvrD-helicase domain-containing protein [Vagococcus sp. B2T-5]
MSNDTKQLEENYLNSTYKQLSETKTYLDNWLREMKSDGQSIMKHITEDIKMNVDGIADKLDSFSQVEMKNREIDQLNIKIKNGEVTLDKVNRLLESPYFGKVVVDFLDDEPVEPFYIGMHGFANQENINLIYDWRSPIAELFYNNELGKSSYNVRGEEIKTSIEERRQFVIEQSKLITYFDTMISIQDDVLLDALASDDTNRMKDITATIQKEQNVVIRDIHHDYILVNGVAGSGKTSAIMQRIAYLLYTFQESITSENVLILSPNKAFIQYVSDVLPALGEKNPRNMTMLQFIQAYLGRAIESETNYFNRIASSHVSSENDILRTKEYVGFIKEKAHHVFDETSLFKAIMYREQPIISQKMLIDLFNDTPKELPHADRIQGTKQKLQSYWERKLLHQSKSKRLHDEVTNLTEDQQEKYFGHLIQNDSEKSLTKYAEQLLRKKYKKVTRQINQYRWLNQDVLFNSLFEMYTGKSYQGDLRPPNLDEAVIQVLINHLFIEKLTMPKMKFVLVDEVQDYTEAQLELLLLLYPNSEFTMVGDENQAIFNTNVSFETINQIFAQRQKQIKNYNLLTSYRSTGAITEVFNQLAMNGSADIVPVRPTGDTPKVVSYKDEEELLKTTQSILASLNGEELSVLVKTEKDVFYLQQLFKGIEAIQVLSINLAKGLEFDNVLVLNVTEEMYHTARDKKILYTAFSRAMSRLFIGYKNERSSLIDFL